ncbi:PEP-CTERM sorting domain-containing protein [Marinobacter confluentis]|uniref:PEP-CTERM sorting domain-containing protein n=1 Tax=Marinobacter confluentis TaxID=1697557 RepID=A0A4Z1BFF5_9GAMM|nr:PEP-CTERM sorting domain-containing protein [Marinobacter confluentis]TGN41464.1 PEP-CTERM sorting domain-containing protein [Marinobacter confluentis]
MKFSTVVRHFFFGFPFVLFAAPALSVPVDLSGWQINGSGNWSLQSNPEPSDSVFQSLNSRPTVFFNGQNSQGTALAGSIEVQTTSDDDFIGFVLGYNDGDLFSDDADYILVDWKQGTQSGWDAGMAISRVTGAIDTCGTCTASDAWQHTGNVEVLERAATLGNTGWLDNTSYLFDIVFTSSNIQVLVNEVLQFDIDGSFQDGSFGFYNFSQPDVLYAGITEEEAPDPDPGNGSDPKPVPTPASLGLMILGLLGLALKRRNPIRQTSV